MAASIRSVHLDRADGPNTGRDCGRGRRTTRKQAHTLREVVRGYEGKLGRDRRWLRVRPAPRERHYEGWIAEELRGRQGIVRDLAQPTEARTCYASDEEETPVSLDLDGTRV